MPPLKKAAVFLDRDGTINEEVGYLDCLEKVALYPQTIRAIKLINESGMTSVVVTNQSGVARGYFTEDFVRETHRHLQELLASGGAHLDAFYYCPHHPEGKGAYRRQCGCRKPEPGMLSAAAEELGLDLGRSYLIGDTLKDMEAAGKIGVKSVLVRTGYGGKAEEEISASGIGPVHVAKDILEAVRWIMKDRSQ